MNLLRLANRAIALLVIFAGLTVLCRAETAGVWLEIPSQHMRVEANEAAELTAGAVPYINVHLSRQPREVDYAKISTRVNSVVANIVSTQRAMEEGIVCSLDLMRIPTVGLRPGRNSVEVTYRDHWNSVHYTSFLLQMPLPAGESVGQPRNHPAMRPFAGGKRYAVVVGVAQYKQGGKGLQNLAYADRDASDLSDLLVKAGGGNISKENVRLLLNQDATLDNVKQALTSFLTAAEPDDTVILYLNMQGAYDPNDPDRKYLMAYDSDPESLANSAMALTELPELLAQSSRSKHVVLLADTCHSRALGEASSTALKAGKEKPTNLVNQYLVLAAEKQGIDALEASDIGEISLEGAQWQGHGAFTYYLLKGLAGEADKNRDGTVSTSELFAYVQQKVTLDTNDQQLPLASVAASGEIAISGVLTAHASAVKPKLIH